MNLKINDLVNKSKHFLSKHSPEILTGIGITGMLTSTILAVKATPKALKLIEIEKDRQNDELYKEAVEKDLPEFNPISSIKPVDAIKVAWKPYIPAVGIGVSSMACIIFASKINYKRNAALATAYSLSERAFTRYKEKVVETIGEKREKSVRDKISQDELNKKKIVDSQIIVTSNDDTLFMDQMSGRIFKSNIDTIKRAVNKLNRDLTYQQYVSLNEFYYEIGLEGVKQGDLLGWNLDQGLIEPSFNTCLTKDEKPCIVIDFMVEPRYDFDKLM